MKGTLLLIRPDQSVLLDTAGDTWAFKNDMMLPIALYATSTTSTSVQQHINDKYNQEEPLALPIPRRLLHGCERQACPGSKPLLPCVNSHCFLLPALLRKVDTRQDSWPVLPESLSFTGYCFL